MHADQAASLARTETSAIACGYGEKIAELFPEAELNQMDDTRDQPSGFQLPQVGIVT